MGARLKYSGNVLPLRRRRRLRRFHATRLVVLCLCATALAFGQHLNHDIQSHGWWENVVDRTVRDQSASGQPRALRGGNAMSGGTGGRAAAFGGRVTYVRDGDTIEVAGRPIRISTLDCAESGTVAGNVASRRMRALVSGENITCSLTGQRSYDRWIGSCRLADGRDIASVLIAERICRRRH